MQSITAYINKLVLTFDLCKGTLKPEEGLIQNKSTRWDCLIIGIIG